MTLKKSIAQMTRMKKLQEWTIAQTMTSMLKLQEWTPQWAETMQQNTTEEWHPTEAPEDAQHDRRARQNSGKEEHKVTHSYTTYKAYDEISITLYPDEDKISVENELPEDTHITINDINVLEQMNTAQLNIYPETGDEVTEDIHESSNTPSNNRYNLRPRPKRRNTRYTMLQIGQQSIMMKLPKLHAHLIMTLDEYKRGHKEIR